MDWLLDRGPWIALAWGLFSAVSLPIGAVLGMWFKPRNVIVAAFMAFGGGALLAALTLDLVQEGIEKEFGSPHVPYAIFSLAVGLAAGGLLFTALDDLVNARGGFLRKTSTALKHIVSLKRVRLKRFIEAIGRIEAFRNIPAHEIRNIAGYVAPRFFKAGDQIFRKGDRGDRMYFILSGRVEVTSEDLDGQGARKIARLSANDVLGEIALIKGRERSASAAAADDVSALELTRADFERVTSRHPEVGEELARLADHRLLDLRRRTSDVDEDTEDWVEDALEAVDKATIHATEEDVKNAAREEGSGAALGIWLGILLDGIPESLVIGASVVGTAVSPSLIAGLFLSNMPESMSSSVLMRKQGYSMKKVMGMWTSLVVLVGIGAFFGNIFFEMLPGQIHVFMAGLASGSMLVMIAQTMLPEAFHQGGGVTGLSTLAGFLVAVLMKLWGP